MNIKCETVSDILKKYGMTNVMLAKRFGLNDRTVRMWTSTSSSSRKCPDYIIRMMDECLSTNGINAPEPVDDMPE